MIQTKKKISLNHLIVNNIQPKVEAAITLILVAMEKSIMLCLTIKDLLYFSKKKYKKT